MPRPGPPLAPTLARWQLWAAMKGRRLLLTVSMLALAAGLVACTHTVVPEHLDAGYDPARIERLTLLPIVDTRWRKFEHVSLTRNVREATLQALREKGYEVAVADGFTGAVPSSHQELLDLPAAELAKLAPADADVFVLLQIESFEAEADELAPTFRLSLAGTIVERAGARMLWRDRAAGYSALTGVFAIFARASVEYQAAVNTVNELFQTLPPVAAAS